MTVPYHLDVQEKLTLDDVAGISISAGDLLDVWQQPRGFQTLY